MIPHQISFPLSLVIITYVVLCNDVSYAIVTPIFPILCHFESTLPPSTIRRQLFQRNCTGKTSCYWSDALLASRVDICFSESGWAIKPENTSYANTINPALQVFSSLCLSKLFLLNSKTWRSWGESKGAGR